MQKGCGRVDINVQKSIEKHIKKNKLRKVWKTVLSTLGCLVVFATTYALILPAITIENTSHCGIEEHLHDELCYVKKLLCEVSEETIHSHTDTCKTEEQRLICGLEETEGHTHTESCVEIQLVLACGMEENIGQQEHIHVEECYQIQEIIICEQEEKEAHTHCDTCYETEEIWVCGLEEGQILETHEHIETCYITELSCEKTEHTHSAICFSDPNADIETAEDWERTLPGELTGIWADDVLAVAKNQLGYSESTNNYIVDEDGEKRGYTRYGAWYGDQYGHWCAMYVSFCLNYANVDLEKIPLDSNCQNWIDTLSSEQYDLYREAGAYEAVPGDLIFFDWDLNGSSDHVGFVVEQIPATEMDTAKIRTIEGNSADCVQYNTYEIDDPTIMGYGCLTENDELKMNLMLQAINAMIYTDETFEVIAESDKTSIIIEGELPEGAYAKAYPVQLEEDLIEGKKVVLAYDITLYDADDNVLDIESKETPMTVTIQPAEWSEITEEVETENYDIYYIPEEGEPEKIESSEVERAVTFQTEHFSTYALVAGGTQNTIYVNGSSGNDTAAGTQRAPVKTFAKAVELVAKGGTIYVSGTITVNDEQSWDLQEQNVTIKRVSSFTGPLVVVSGNGRLTMANVTVNGGSADPSSSDIATNSTYASGSAKAPLIVVEDKGTLNIKAGAVLTNNSNKPNSSNNKFVESGYIGLGGAVYCAGTLIMEGGLIQKCEAQCGGGVYVENGDFYMTGGTIDMNYARDIVSYRNRVDNFHKNAGGGVYVGDHASMTMTGGTISNNQTSREGGGISLGWLERGDNTGIASYITTFTMNGGTITGNYAVMTGGGLNITAGRQAFINAGYITENQADGKEYQNTSNKVSAGSYSRVYSGGAIYIDAAQWSDYSKETHSGVPGKAVINRALITQNTATSNGGGIATCSTSSSYIYGTSTNGTAVYNNKVNNKDNELYVYGKLTLGQTLLGGGRYNWTKSSSGNGTIYYNSLTDSSTAIQKAKELATVFIMNNTAYLGGAIGCNGVIEIGGEGEESTYLNIKKVWDDDGKIEHPEFIEIQILQDGKPYGEPKKIYRTFDEAGNEIWPTFYIGGLPSGHKYTIQEIEVPGYTAAIEQDGQDFVITNQPSGFRVTKKWLDADGKDLKEDLPEYIEVELYQNDVPYGEIVRLTADKEWTYMWLDLPKADEAGEPYTYTVKEINIPEGYVSTGEGILDEQGNYVIINTKSARTSISVEKKWADGAAGADKVTVQLLQNGETYRNTVELHANNQWFNKWEDLPVHNTDGSEFIYEVEEVPVAGYSSAVTEGSTDVKYHRWMTDDGFDTDTQYMIISSERALADNGSGGFKWVDVSTALADGGIPSDTSVLWTRDSANKLRNSGSGNYVYYQDEKFTTNSSSTAVYFDDGKLYVTTTSWIIFTESHYLTNVSGTTSKTESDGMTFTLYKRVEESLDYGDKHLIVTNTKKPSSISVNFAKYSVSEDDLYMLAGAQLELYKSDGGSTQIPNTQESGTLIGQWTSEAAVSESDGIHTLDLDAGTYYLIETKTPEGHAGLSGPIIFTVDINNGRVSIVNYPGREDVTITVTEDGKADFPIYNESIFELPETGGIGTYMFLTGGIVLIFGSLLYGCYMLQRRERRFK